MDSMIILFVIFILFLLSGITLIMKFWIQQITKHKEEEQLKLPGNAMEYDLNRIVKNTKSTLIGKKILFLGSSVTYGVAGISFVEYLMQKDGVIIEKQAVSGTTLADEWSAYSFIRFGNGDSYVKRLIKRVKTSEKYDCFICQLSTNDASAGKEIGAICNSKKSKDFDTSTIIGAIEYIIAYVRMNWNCPIVFYTGCYYENQVYEKMVHELYALSAKWGIEIIDLFTDKEFNNISNNERELYMMDRIHPTRAGYLNWWLPKFEERLEQILISDKSYEL